MKCRLLTLALCMAVFGCSDDKKSGPSVVLLPDTGNTADAAATDVGTDTSSTDAEMLPDFETDTNVAMPGFLNGVWVVKVDGETKATLTIRHEDGQSEASGTFVQTTPAANGEINAVRWDNEVLTASWTIRVDNVPETFGVSDGSADDQNTISGRYTDSSTGAFSSCVLERQI